MCWLCDHPGATELDYQDHLRQLIDTFGWAVQGVEREFYGRRIRGLQLVHADKVDIIIGPVNSGEALATVLGAPERALPWNLAFAGGSVSTRVSERSRRPLTCMPARAWP